MYTQLDPQYRAHLHKMTVAALESHAAQMRVARENDRFTSESPITEEEAADAVANEESFDDSDFDENFFHTPSNWT